jgi:ABC-type metal ion transport system substrate-binding protein
MTAVEAEAASCAEGVEAEKGASRQLNLIIIQSDNDPKEEIQVLLEVVQSTRKVSPEPV